MQLSIRGATCFLFVHAISSTTTGLTKDAETTLPQDGSLDITNSTLAAEVLSHLKYKDLTSQPSPLLNTTVPSIPNSNATSLEGLHVICEGHNVLQSSCFDAINTFGPQSPRYLSVGERVPGMLNYDLNLPVRWISGDGRCIIDLIKDLDTAVARVMPIAIRTAVFHLIATCVTKGQGGVVTGLSPDKDLAITLRSHRPQNVVCGPSHIPPFPDNCDFMSATMETAMQPLLRFGPAGSPNIDAGLPSSWSTRAPLGCLRTISATDLGRATRDSISRYDLWQAFVLIKGMCVRYGRYGRITGLGTGGKMQMDAISPVSGSEREVGAS